jgi:uncharacterized membrane protein
MLESHLLVPVMMRDVKLLEGNWGRTLSEDLLIPSFKINRREAMGRRLRRNYIWIFLILLAAWILKIYLHCYDHGSVVRFLEAASNGQPLPAVLFWLMVGIFYLLICYLFLYSYLSPGLASEFKRQAVKPTEWTM